MEPGGQSRRQSDRTSAAGQHQKGGLEGILGGVFVAEDSASGGQDHRAVPRDECGEGGLVAPVGEAGEQLAIVGRADRSVLEQRLDHGGAGMVPLARHRQSSPQRQNQLLNHHQRVAIGGSPLKFLEGKLPAIFRSAFNPAELGGSRSFPDP